MVYSEPSNDAAVTKIRCTNDWLILPKGLAFFTALSGVGWNRFGVFYLLDAGLSPADVGFLKTLGFFSKVVAQPLWGIIADSTSLRSALILSFTISAVSLEIVRQGVNHHWPFYIFCFIRMLRGAMNAVSPLVDAIIVEEVRGSTEGYGKQKLYSSAAWGIGAFMMGGVVDRFGLESIFLQTYVLSAVCVVLVYWMSRRQEGKDKGVGGSTVGTRDVGMEDLESGDIHIRKRKGQQDDTFAADETATPEKGNAPPFAKRHKPRSSPIQVLYSVLSMLKLPGLSVVAMQIFSLGFVMVLADSILYLQIEQEWKLSRQFNGLTTTVSVLSALPSYFFSERTLVKRGAIFMFRFAQITTCIRLLLTATLTKSTSFWILPMQLLHGISFSMNWTAATEVFQAASPSSITASAQVIVTQLYFTLGQGLGYLFWSNMYTSYGASPAYCLGSFLLAVNLSATWRLFPERLGSARLYPTV